MAKLLFPPAASSYAVQLPAGALSVKLDGGAARYRTDVLHGSFRVRAAWFCSPKQYQYLNAFYRSATAFGALPFDVRLRLDREPAKYVSAHFMPGTLRFTRMEGRLRVMEAELEVVKAYDPSEQSADEAIITAYETSRGVSGD